MRLIALCVLVGWLTLSANAQTRDGEDRCDASNFACRADVLQALKSCEQNYRIGGDWLNPTYNETANRNGLPNSTRHPPPKRTAAYLLLVPISMFAD